MTTKTTEEQWREEFRSLMSQKSGSEIEKCLDMEIFISSLLLSQAHVLKERMKACVPEEGKIIKYEDEKYWVKGFNDCREQTLSAMESIEV